MTKTAVVLFNLGGPDCLDAVQPFLFNLFNDPAIISLPAPFRWLVAQLASRRRAPFAQDIYRQMGDRSPLLEQTEAQAKALELELNDQGPHQTRVFIAMRYWHPMTADTMDLVVDFAPDQVILLPLYPQFSTTTTGSSMTAWAGAATAAGLACPTITVCCYPTDPLFVRAHAAQLDEALRSLNVGHGNVGHGNVGRGPAPKQDLTNLQILFSAHGLPKKIVDRGDPYPEQVEQTAAAVMSCLKSQLFGWKNLEWQVCYQSRVGPLEWIGPATEDAIGEAARSGKQVVVVPIAFVSEHAETLVELDIEYRGLASRKGATGYLRVPALTAHNQYISCLAALVKLSGQSLEEKPALTEKSGSSTGPACYAAGGHYCPHRYSQCPVLRANLSSQR